MLAVSSDPGSKKPAGCMGPTAEELSASATARTAARMPALQRGESAWFFMLVVSADDITVPEPAWPWFLCSIWGVHHGPVMRAASCLSHAELDKNAV